MQIAPPPDSVSVAGTGGQSPSNSNPADNSTENPKPSCFTSQPDGGNPTNKTLSSTAALWLPLVPSASLFPPRIAAKTLAHLLFISRHGVKGRSECHADVGGGGGRAEGESGAKGEARQTQTVGRRPQYRPLEAGEVRPLMERGRHARSHLLRYPLPPVPRQGLRPLPVFFVRNEMPSEFVVGELGVKSCLFECREVPAGGMANCEGHIERVRHLVRAQFGT